MIDHNRIDYSKISEAITHYRRAGYDYVEVPWLVSRESIDVTKPPHVSSLVAAELSVRTGGLGFEWGHFVGSGEQSFIEIRDKGDLLIGAKRCCATPCFRDEQKLDDLHRRYFFKVELIEVVHPKSDCEPLLERMISIAEAFFSFYVPIRRVKTDEGFDIQLDEPKNPVELGSYGVREIKGFKWIYGTGCAEPRLSQAEWIHEEAEDERRRKEFQRRLKKHERCRLESGSGKASRRHKKTSR